MNSNPSHDEYLIIEISDASSGVYEDAIAIKRLLMVESFEKFYTNGTDKAQERNNVNHYNFCFLDQNQDGLEQTIKNIVTANRNRKVLLAVHKTESNNHMEVVNRLRQKPIKKKVEFSHGLDWDIWTKGLKPLVDSIGKNQEDYDRHFKTLCALIYSPLKEARNLKRQVLTPLVALNWLGLLPESSEANRIKERALRLYKDVQRSYPSECRALGLPTDFPGTDNLDFRSLKVFAESIEERIRVIQDETNEGRC